MIPEYECTSYCDVGQPWPDAGFDGGGDGGTSDGGQVVCTADCPTSEMVDVPAGVFMMGCNNAVDTECAPEENPYHEVNVPDFEIDKYEVIVSDYKTCVDAGGCTAADTRKDCNYGASGKDDHPINCVKWGQAKSFCLWAGKRLPTEAEWEKAARGTDGRKYPWGNDSLDCDHAVISVPPCSNPGTAPVGSKPAGASPYGVLDMIGNVWEMVEDDWHDSYSGAPVDGSAWVENPRIVPRVLRGGGLQADSDNLDTLRASHRWYYEINFNGHDVGFRCALSVP
jgi:formylglycine-generating enzyme required for sulfatase activity